MKELIEGAWYRNKLNHLVGPMVDKYPNLPGVTYQFTDGISTYGRNGNLYEYPLPADLDTEHPLNADGSPWGEKTPQEYVNEVREKCKEMGIPDQIIKDILPKETKGEKKMVSIELPEEYVRSVAKCSNENELIKGCKEWVKANPEPKQMRAMTTEEKLKWAMANADKKIGLIYQCGLRKGYSQMDKAKCFSIKAYRNATGYIVRDTCDVEHKFEVEVSE